MLLYLPTNLFQDDMLLKLNTSIAVPEKGVDLLLEKKVVCISIFFQAIVLTLYYETQGKERS
jgi:hypothetical protein